MKASLVITMVSLMAAVVSITTCWMKLRENAKRTESLTQKWLNEISKKNTENTRLSETVVFLQNIVAEVEKEMVMYEKTFDQTAEQIDADKLTGKVHELVLHEKMNTQIRLTEQAKLSKARKELTEANKAADMLLRDNEDLKKENGLLQNQLKELEEKDAVNRAEVESRERENAKLRDEVPAGCIHAVVPKPEK